MKSQYLYGSRKKIFTLLIRKLKIIAFSDSIILFFIRRFSKYLISFSKNCKKRGWGWEEGGVNAKYFNNLVKTQTTSR